MALVGLLHVILPSRCGNTRSLSKDTNICLLSWDDVEDRCGVVPGVDTCQSLGGEPAVHPHPHWKDPRT